MTKAQREKAERLMLKNMLDTSPKMKEIIDGLIESPNPELADILKANIKPLLDEQFMLGTQTGFISALLTVREKIKPCGSIDEAVEKLTKEVDEMRSKMGLKPIDEELAEDEENV